MVLKCDSEVLPSPECKMLFAVRKVIPARKPCQPHSRLSHAEVRQRREAYREDIYGRASRCKQQSDATYVKANLPSPGMPGMLA